MKRSTRTNLVLAGIVAVLGFVVYLQVGHEVAQFEPPLTAMDTTSVERVAVRCRECVERRFVRSNGHWSMQAPYAMPADDAAVDRLVAIAASPVRIRHAGDAFEASRIGLDPPLMTLELGAVQLDVGLSDALRGDRYVRIGDTIAMVPDRFSPFLAALPESELDRHLVPRGIELVGLRIDDIEHAERIADWNGVVARRITSADPETNVTDAVHVELLLGNDERIEYHVIRIADGYIARRDSLALDYMLDEQQVHALLGETRTH